jgi:quercetin dioxygenase-like cupin family protein
VSDRPRAAEASSCEVPAEPLDERLHRRFDPQTFTWEGVATRVYKLGPADAAGMLWRDVVRHTLSDGSAGAFALRYFEIAPGGYSSLEKHRHIHAVVVLRGAGHVVVGRQVYAVAPFDLVYVPPMVAHQFINTGQEPFGFLCPVDSDRDPPQPLTAEELADLLSEPAVRAVLRIAGTRERGNAPSRSHAVAQSRERNCPTARPPDRATARPRDSSSLPPPEEKDEG